MLALKENELENAGSLSSLKVCRFYNQGYCKLDLECKSYHPEKVCEALKNEGFCARLNCRGRHPRTCRYWRRTECYRGKSCHFRHYWFDHEEESKYVHKKCERCEKKAFNMYYCEFCGKDFCNECTNDKAHTKKTPADELDCNHIHKVLNDDLNEVENDNVTMTEHDECQCGKNDKRNFQCDLCSKYFCDACSVSLS